jgi:hypothetical protein
VLSQRITWIALTVLLGLAAFLTGVNGPLASLIGWHPAAGSPQPTAAQLPFFMVLGLAEALALGFGVAFLVFGYPWMRAAAAAAPGGLTRAAHLAIGWMLVNWWSHDSFHVANGLDLSGLLLIEYGYHFTLIVAGTIAAAWFVTVVRGHQLTAAR